MLSVFSILSVLQLFLLMILFNDNNNVCSVLYDGTCLGNCGTCVMKDGSVCVDAEGDEFRCWCNADCTTYGDCCGDVTAQCGYGCNGPNCPNLMSE